MVDFDLSQLLANPFFHLDYCFQFIVTHRPIVVSMTVAMSNVYKLIVGELTGVTMHPLWD